MIWIRSSLERTYSSSSSAPFLFHKHQTEIQKTLGIRRRTELQRSINRSPKSSLAKTHLKNPSNKYRSLKLSKKIRRQDKEKDINGCKQKVYINRKEREEGTTEALVFKLLNIFRKRNDRPVSSSTGKEKNFRTILSLHFYLSAFDIIWNKCNSINPF